MKHTQTLFIQGRRDYKDEMQYILLNVDMSQFGYIQVGTLDVEFEVPDDFNPTQAEIEVLEKEKQRLRAELSVKLMNIDDQISKLQCLTYIPAEVEA